MVLIGAESWASTSFPGWVAKQTVEVRPFEGLRRAAALTELEFAWSLDDGSAVTSPIVDSWLIRVAGEASDVLVMALGKCLTLAILALVELRSRSRAVGKLAECLGVLLGSAWVISSTLRP